MSQEPDQLDPGAVDSNEPRNKVGRRRLPDGKRKEYFYSFRADEEWRKIVTKLRRHFGFDSESEVIREGVFLLEQKANGRGEASQLPLLRQIHEALGESIRQAEASRSIALSPQSQLGLFTSKEPEQK